MGDPLTGDEEGRVTPEEAARLRSIADRAMDGDAAAEPEPLFPLGVGDGDGVHPKNRIKPSHQVETTVSLSKAEVPLRNGLPDANKRARYLVTGLPGTGHDVPLREDESNPDKVTGYKVRQDVRVVHVQSVPLLDADLVQHVFRTVLDGSPSDAGALLDSLQAMAAETLSAAA